MRTARGSKELDQLRFGVKEVGDSALLIPRREGTTASPKHTGAEMWLRSEPSLDLSGLR